MLRHLADHFQDQREFFHNVHPIAKAAPKYLGYLYREALLRVNDTSMHPIIGSMSDSELRENLRVEAIKWITKRKNGYTSSYRHFHSCLVRHGIIGQYEYSNNKPPRVSVEEVNSIFLRHLSGK